MAVAFGEILFSRFRVKLPGRVTYLALEEPAERTHHRLRQMVPAYDVRLENIQFLYQIQPLMGGGAAQLDAFLTANPSEAVIIDTLSHGCSAFEPQGRAAWRLHRGDTLRQIAVKHRTAMLCVAHSRKAAGDIRHCPRHLRNYCSV